MNLPKKFSMTQTPYILRSFMTHCANLLNQFWLNPTSSRDWESVNISTCWSDGVRGRGRWGDASEASLGSKGAFISGSPRDLRLPLLTPSPLLWNGKLQSLTSCPLIIASRTAESSVKLVFWETFLLLASFFSELDWVAPFFGLQKALCFFQCSLWWSWPQYQAALHPLHTMRCSPWRLHCPHARRLTPSLILPRGTVSTHPAWPSVAPWAPGASQGWLLIPGAHARLARRQAGCH